MFRRALLLCAACGAFLAGGWTDAARPAFFSPAHRLSGVGADRENLSDLVLAARTEAMVEGQTFSIMRDPQSVAGAQRITASRLQSIFRKAATRSGLPVDLIEAVAYLESWGVANAESPSGPKGIMQISEGTARRMGLRITYATRYRVTKQRVLVKRKGRKPAYRTVRKKVPYSVLVRDERLLPDRAIPAAADYLAELEQRFGGRDWAVFAYHCGEGCASEMLSITRAARGAKTPPTVAQMFFLGTPAYNRNLYEAVSHHMQRDYSPTYWFRVMRAQQLLDLWREDPEAFRRMAGQYQAHMGNGARAPHRLSVWLKSEDLLYRNCEDIISDRSGRLAQALDAPDFLGYSLRKSGPGSIGFLDPERRRYYMRAAPSALGALSYIAFETRRLHQALHARGERFQPLEVTALVQPVDYRDRLGAAQDQPEFLAHCTGQVFDIDINPLPRRQQEALRFVLDDLGWGGYLGFIEESPGSGRIHVGASPSSREFFTRVFEESLGEPVE